jgi:hypothetical protein
MALLLLTMEAAAFDCPIERLPTIRLRVRALDTLRDVEDLVPAAARTADLAPVAERAAVLAPVAERAAVLAPVAERAAVLAPVAERAAVLAAGRCCALQSGAANEIAATAVRTIAKSRNGLAVPAILAFFLSCAHVMIFSFS